MWNLDQIAADDASRAATLEAAPSATDLAHLIVAAFAEGLRNGNTRLAVQESPSSSADVRALIHFHVGATLFDRFMNARTGYRAQFRLGGYKHGLQYNGQMVDELRRHVSGLPLDTPVRRVGASLEHRHLPGSLNQLIDSLDPALSKIWHCNWVLLEDGRAEQFRFRGRLGPRIRVAANDLWAAPYREENEAWLEIKGAFVSEHGLYQIKDPGVRAKTLERTGEA